MNYTPKQLRILNIIHDFNKNNGVTPTLQEISKIVGVSPVTVFEHMKALEKKGAITRRTHSARSAEISDTAFLERKKQEKQDDLIPLLTEIKNILINDPKYSPNSSNLVIRIEAFINNKINGQSNG